MNSGVNSPPWCVRAVSGVHRSFLFNPEQSPSPIDVAQPVAATHSEWEALTGVNMTFTVTRSTSRMLGGGSGPDATIDMRSNAWVGPECTCSSAGLRKSGGGVAPGLISQHCDQILELGNLGNSWKLCDAESDKAV